MFEVHVTKEMALAAKQKADEMGALYGSILKGAGNFAGFVGEMAAASVLSAETTNTLDYDLTWKGVTIDVKTKQSDYVPKGTYEASVADYNPTQKCDFYLFTRFSRRNWVVYILGFYPQSRYVSDATFFRRGDIDPSNNFLVKADMHNLPHQDLWGWECTSSTEFAARWEKALATV